MNWSDFTSALYTLLQIGDTPGQTLYNAILPRMIDDAELYLFQHPKLDWLATRTTDRSQVTTQGNRAVIVPTAFIVLEDISLIIPAGAQPLTPGAQRIPYTRTSRAFIDMCWPQETLTAAPDPINGGYWALFNQQEPATNPPPPVPVAGQSQTASNLILMPTPDNQYVVEQKGTFRPTPFYIVAGFNPQTGIATQPTATTFLSTYMPHLLIAASMLISTAYQRLWSGVAEDPRMAVSWRLHLEDLIDGAYIESLRQKQTVGGWSSYPLNPTLAPPAISAPPGMAQSQAR